MATLYEMRPRKNNGGQVKTPDRRDVHVVDRAPHENGGELRIRSGPLPTPEELFNYQQLIPGAADRIIAMAEREQAHRMNMEDLQSRSDIKHRDDLVASQRQNAAGVFRSDLAGQLLGSAVAIAATAGAVYTAYIGAHPTVSIALVSLPVAAIVKAIRSNGNGKDVKRN